MAKIRVLFVLMLGAISMFSQEQLELLDHWKVDSIPGSRAYNNAYNEVWGVVVDGNEYGIIGSTLGTHIFDVSQPGDIKEIHFIPGQHQGTSIIHRDFHDYEGYLYIVADEGSRSTLQIVDISDLPETVDVKYDSKELIRRSHNIFIDSTGARLYSLISDGTSVNFAPMRVFDISEPTNPVILQDFYGFNGVGISQVHDAYVEDDIAYLNCGPRGFFIVDLSDLDNPITLSYVAQGEFGISSYNHSGWLSTDGTAYYTADEVWGESIKVFDVSDPENIDLTTTINADSESRNSIPHNQVVACDYLFSSYYYDGLQVYDISDPLYPKRAYYYPTSQIAHRANYEGAWGVYPLLPSGIILVSDMQEGLFVLKGPQNMCDNSTSVEKIENDINIVLSPNPVSQFQVLNVRSDEHFDRAVLVNILGQSFELDFKQIGSNVEIDFNHTPVTIGLNRIIFYSEKGAVEKSIIVLD